ncbi:SDR family NAD(P)-dependent oxidoreductase [Vibrio rotiferianus]|uniref:SDR family NAD(P)-dependent oxidoreductase n=1 Tax=Vibrio rotiferianus TaxID=190895 RepID=UPI000B59B10B|nr:SDR family NAD(P)-dependent oxidoreductase [Vibrio rotiferianus]ASI96620.1 flavin reductase [Vibrio rotiferianus]
MNRVVVWGASSGLGLAIAKYFAEKGAEVVGVARNPEKSPELKAICQSTLACDATVAEEVDRVVEQLNQEDIIISTMGSFRADIPVDYLGHRYLIDAACKASLKRFVLVTSLGCGDSWKYLSDRSKAGFGGVVREKSLAEAWLQTSDLDYTIIRPGGLKDGEATGTGVLNEPTEVHGLIYRQEVARLAYEMLERGEGSHQIYHCVDSQLG